MQTFYWFDLETSGLDPRRSRIAQFAGQRTDPMLQPVDDPLVLFCRPADDLLPAPEAALLTGITPQQCCREGLPEAEFAARIHAELARPGTCVAGYNNLRFDDEFIRFALYRNFFDPYEREWKDGNSRWDLLDLMRLAYALRPEGIEWPYRADGTPSFRLEDLSAANGLTHSRAHDALSDVEALIALARRVRQAQPRLFDYYLRLRDKRFATRLLDCAAMTPVLHVSGRFSPQRRCTAPVLPLTAHPKVPNRIICLDLDRDPAPFLEADAETIAERLYLSAADMPDAIERFALKEVHLNRSPALVAWAHVRTDDWARLGIDPIEAQARADRVRAAAGLAERVRQAFLLARGEYAGGDVDGALYDGFPAECDRRCFAEIRATAPERLAAFVDRLTDSRYRELLFRYQARNWPESLNYRQQERWNAFRRQRLTAEDSGSEYTFDSYFAALATLRQQHAEPGSHHLILDALADWGLQIQRSLGVEQAGFISA